MTLAEYEAQEFEGWLDETASQQPLPEPVGAAEVPPGSGAIRAPRTLVRAEAAYRAEVPAVDPNQMDLPLWPVCRCGDALTRAADLTAGCHPECEAIP